MRTQGKDLAVRIIPALKGEFGKYEVVSAEEKIYLPIDDVIFNNTTYNFKGFI